MAKNKQKKYPRAYVLTANDYESTDVIAVLLPPKPVNFNKLRRSWEYKNGEINLPKSTDHRDDIVGQQRYEKLKAFAEWLVKEHGFEISRFEEYGTWVGGYHAKPLNQLWPSDGGGGA